MNNRNKPLEVRAEFKLYTNTVDLYLLQRLDSERIAVCDDIVMKTYNVNEAVHNDTPIRLLREQAVELMNDLWRAGVRPHNITDVPGVTSAQTAHIKDLQTITHKLVDAVLEAKR